MREIFRSVVVLGLLLTAAPASARPHDHHDMGPVHRFTPELGIGLSAISFANGIVIDTRVDGEPDLPASLRYPAVPPGRPVRIVQFRGPVERRWLRRLHARGIETFGYLPNHAVLARLDRHQTGLVKSLPDVKWVGLFQPAYKLEPGLRLEGGAVKVVLLVTPGADAAPVERFVADSEGAIVDVESSDFGTTITATLAAESLPSLAALQEVLWIQEWSEAELANNNCQWVTQTGWRSTAPPDTSMAARRVWAQGVRGQRVVLSTTDTGNNMGHDLFRDPSLSATPPGIWPAHRKVVAFKLFGTASASESPYHGSHVNGTVCGDDSATGGSSYYDGMSTKGRLYFVDVSNASGSLITGTDLTALWDTVYLGRGLPDSIRPIVQHSGSWGWSNSLGNYRIQDASTDAFGWAHKDFLNIMAAGNEYSTRRIRNPGIAKNVVTVGATQNGTLANQIASFSSRGPTQDNRIKPTVCAPGVQLWSAYYTGSNTYQQLSGTSMATPATNGTIGLMRCYLREGYYPTGSPVPGNRIGYISAALLRSMAIVSADPNVGSYVVPSFDMGWGRVDADSVLYFAGDSRKLIVTDDTSGVATGEYKQLAFRVNSSIPLKVCLVWTDTAAAPYASPTLVNDLNLEVLAPGGTYYRGNRYSGGQSIADPTGWDSINVEECVRVNSPTTGTWTIRVRGQQVVTASDQPFAWTITGDVSLNLDDVGVTGIVAPSGVVDLGTSVTPACSVWNYGTASASYDVRMQIGTGFDTTVAVSGHLPGTGRQVGFPNWTAGPVGPVAVRCSTRLTGDANDANDRDTATVIVRYRDVGCRSIVAPTGTIDSGATVVPACSTFNYGNVTESYPVVAAIGGSYLDTASIAAHAPGTGRLVTFAAWTATQRGSNAVRCSTRLDADMSNGNDRATGSVDVRVIDVGAAAIEAPTGTVDSGAVVTPACSVYNWGTTSASYDVRMRVGTGYVQTASVVAHGPASWRRVSFPAWTATLRGLHAVSCSTELTGDAVVGNDRVEGTVLVRALDVEAVAVVSPTGLVVRDRPVTPVGRWRNNGNLTADFEAWMLLEEPGGARVYAERVAVTGLAGDADTLIGFPDHTPTTSGVWTVRCSTRLAGDLVPANDTIGADFLVGVPDIGVRMIVAPTGRVDTGTTVVPSARIRNYGSVELGFRAWFALEDTTGEVYRESLDVAPLMQGAETTLVFPGHHVGTIECQWATRCSVGAPQDQVPANDVLNGRFVVSLRPDWPNGWIEVAPVPLPASGRPVKRGGWLAGNEGNGLIYAAKGNKTGDFYYYDPIDDAWTMLAPMPLGAEGKPVEKGSRGAADGDNWVYATKGANTPGFWRYGVAQDTWYQLPDVPLGISGKKVKGGTDMVHATVGGAGYVYLMKGCKTEFYRYDPVLAVWQERAQMPIGIRAKWNRGSWLAYAGGDHIWAHKAKYHELWRYDVLGDSWTGPFAGMPYIGLSGRRKKSKDGGSAGFWADEIYALKGGNTCEFWRYDPGTDRWAELAQMPEVGSTGRRKRVKHGGDLCAWRFGSFFALKGNKTSEFWRYVEPLVAGPRPDREGIATKSGATPLRLVLELRPNPLAGRTIAVRYGLPTPGPAGLVVYDVAGRPVVRRSFLAGRSGMISVDMAGLSAGVYLVRLEAACAVLTGKLVVE